MADNFVTGPFQAGQEYLYNNLTVGADNQFAEVGTIISNPKSIGDVMNNLANRIVEKTKQEINRENLEYSGNLLQKVDMPIKIFAQTFVAELIMADYYDYINKGVRGKGGTTKAGMRWKIKAPNSPYFYKDKKPPLFAIYNWSREKGFNPFVMRNIIYHSGIRPRHYFDRVLEDINNGEIKTKFIQELNEAGGSAIAKGMKDILTR
jgi:hypothetical protein